jgi:hypothetical protein
VVPMDDTATNPSRALIPYNPAEGIPIKKAVAIAGRSQRTIRRWCADFGIGRRIANGNWIISRPALNMLIEGDHEALTGYLDGARAQFAPVARHFQEVGLGHLLTLREFGAEQRASA